MKRIALCFGTLFLGVLFFSVWTLVSGPVDVPFAKLLDSLMSPDSSMVSRILWELRIPRVAAAVLAGMSLAVSGLCLQTVFRNPLCGPFVLGISSGASFGVALALLAGISIGHFGTLGAASVGALVVTLVIIAFASRFSQSSVLLVAGLLLGYFIDALVSLLIAGAEGESLQVYVAWGFGSFGRLTLDGIWVFALAVVVGLLPVVLSMRYLNSAHLGDEFVRGLGIQVGRSRLCVLVGSSILAGAATAFCGPVAFIGIAVPHLSYLMFRTTNHRVLLPGSALCGSLLALVAGVFPQWIPLNAVLSVVGVPVILYVLVRGARQGRSL